MKAMCLYLMIVLVLAIACGGGSDESSPSSVSSLKIELHSSSRSKLVNFEDGTPFVIASDQNNRTDPTEATHARVNVYDSFGKFQMSAQKKIERFDTPPYQVDPDSRFVNLKNPPSGNIRIEVQLGQDFGVTSGNTRQEVIYYSGSTNVFLSGNVAIIDNVKSTTIPVKIKNVIDESSQSYVIQGYFDLVNYPTVIEAEEEDIFSDELSISTVTFISENDQAYSDLEVSLKNTYGETSTPIKLNDLNQPLSFFFEVPNISADDTAFTVAAETGAPVNFVLRGYIPPSESGLSIPILLDWETTWAKIMTDWFLFEIANNQAYFISDSYATNYLAMSNVFVGKQDLFLPSSSGNSYADPYVLNAQDLLLAEITFAMFRILNLGDKTSDTSSASRIDTKVISNSFTSTAGVEYFFFSGGNTNSLSRSLKVNLEFSNDTLSVPVNPNFNVLLDNDREPVLDSEGELIILKEPELDDLVLVNEYQSSVVDISFNRTSLVEYLYSLMVAEVNSEKP